MNVSFGLANPETPPSAPIPPCAIIGKAQEHAVDSLLCRITITPGLRSGQPCIRDLRITVWDILKWLGTGATHAQTITDYPELTEDDILAALQRPSVKTLPPSPRHFL